MAVRPIDGNVLIEWFRPYLHTGEAIPADVVIEDICSMPTLTPPNEWVSAEERLPEHLKDVLALYGNGRIDIDWVNSSGNFKFGSLFDGVTHWMLLPAPPDKEQTT